MFPFRQAGNAENALQFGGVVLWSKRRARTIVPYRKLFSWRFGALGGFRLAHPMTLSACATRTYGAPISQPEAALHSLDGKASTLSPRRLRHLLASFIVERVMHGEIDVNQLALEAVESLDGAKEASA